MLFYYVFVCLQIVLESLPISSSAHVQLLELYSGAFGLSSKTLYLLHVPTAAMLALFFQQEWRMMLQVLFRRFSLMCKTLSLVCIVDLLTVCMFVVLHYIPLTIPLGVGLSITALMLYSLAWCPDGQKKFGVNQAFVLGGVQAVALLPGISRFASMYVAARWLGISHRRAFEITWMVAFPLFVAPVLLLGTTGVMSWTVSDISVLTVIVVCIASIVSYLLLWAVQWAARYNYLWMMSIYMIVPIGMWCVHMLCRS